MEIVEMQSKTSNSFKTYLLVSAPALVWIMVLFRGALLITPSKLYLGRRVWPWKLHDNACFKVATNFKVFLLEPNPEKPAYAAEIGEHWDPNWAPWRRSLGIPTSG